MPMTLGQFRTLTEPGLSNIWHDSWPPSPSEFDRIFNVRNMEKAVITDAKLAGFGALQTQDEGQSVVYDAAIPPVTRNYEFTRRALGYKITDKLNDLELYGQVAQFERDLMRASQYDIETFAFAVLNNATGTTISTGFDGLALSSTAHTRLDGGATQANRPTSLGALSVATLQDAFIQFKKWVNDRGRPVVTNPRLLVIPPDLEFTARELLESASRPDTANDTANIINRLGLDILVSRYITAATFWAVVGDAHDLNFLWAKNGRPTTGSEVDFDTDTIKRKVRQGYARGHGEWRGFYQGNS